MKNLLVALLLWIFFAGCESSSSERKQQQHISGEAAPPERPFPRLTAEEKDRYYREVDYVLQRSLLRTTFNGAILVAKNGEIVYEKYVGVKQPRTQDSITAETSFQIASTGKTLTAAAVLKLAQENKLSLEDPVEKYFPGFPYEGITVKLLLTHRSGLPEYLYYFEKHNWDRKKLISNDDVVYSLKQWKPQRSYRPDIRFSYCNTNYVLLASIVEKVSGMPFPEYMKQHIFEPLGMNNSFVHHIDNKDSVLLSFQPNNALWTLDFSDGPFGDKNIYSTPRDLLKWDQSLYVHTILTPEMLDSAYKPYSNERPGVNNYGLGWRMLLLPNGKKVVFHNGHWHGFNSAFARLTDEHATIIIISNKYNQSVYTTAKRLYNVFGDYGGKQQVTASGETVQEKKNTTTRKQPAKKKVTRKKRAQ